MNFEDLFPGFGSGYEFRTQEKFPNLFRYPKSVQEALILGTILIEKCDAIMARK